MKNSFLVLCFFICCFYASAQKYKEMINSSSYSVNEIVEEANLYFKDRDKGRGSGYKQFKRWEYHAYRNMDENGFVTSSYQNQKELERYISMKSFMRKSSTTYEGNWQELGPNNWDNSNARGWNPGIGRIHTISFDDNDANHFIVGSDSGGIWETFDYGSSWNVLTDDYTRLDVRSLLISPHNSNTYFWGSNNGIIYKSLDSGSTWQELADFNFGEVLKIIVSPDDSNIMFAAISNAGVYKSLDAGDTWSLIHLDSVSGYDVELDPNNSNNIIATGKNVFTSIDGGVTFSKDTTSGFSTGPKMLAYSESNSQKIYIVEARGSMFNGFYRSVDGGSSFSKLDHTGKNYFGYKPDASDSLGQAPIHMGITVNPADEDEVHIAGIISWRSFDGGDSFQNSSQWYNSLDWVLEIGYCHADITSLEFNNGDLFVTSDGGVYRSSNPSGVINENFYEDLSEGMGISQFYKIGISQTNTVTISGGTQDNGTSYYNESENWSYWLGADGMETFISKDNPSIIFGTVQLGEMYRTNDNGVTFIDVLEPEGKGGNGYNWVVPLEQDPVLENTLYVAYDEVYKSEDNGETWLSISQNLISNIDNLKVSEASNETMYLSINNLLYKTTDAGNTDWLNITSLPSNLGNITSIALNPLNVNEVALAGTGSDKVAFSSDGGLTWSVLKSNLPNFRAKALVFYENDIILGMNYGVYVLKEEDKTSWQSFSNNLPNVNISELEINYETDILYASTYGRGIWFTTLDDNSLYQKTFENTLEKIIVYKSKDSDYIEFLGDGNFTSIKLYNKLGQLVYKDVLSNDISDYKMDVSKQKSGLYFLNIEYEGFVTTKKILLD